MALAQISDKSSAWRSGNRQIAVNMVATILSYGISLGISFFLTPYIVSRLGAAAYGFLGLSNNIIGYTSLITVALNSMAGRFVSIHYHKGDYDTANRYMSSTVVGNIGLAVLIVMTLGILTFFLEDIINIPPDLVGDVKFLFTLLFVNGAVGLCTSVINFPTFIKNRLDLGNIYGIIGNLLRVVLIIVAYGFFPAHLWYIGAVGLLCSFYSIFVNYGLYRRLTPELKFKISSYRLKLVWEMSKEGAWNLLSQFSSILNQGLELLLANIFVGAYYMGILSITKTLPFIILGIFAALGGNFHPEAVKLYAEKNLIAMRNMLVKGIRILGAIAAIPCAGVMAYGDIFYASWLPGQDYALLYHISVVTMIWLTTTLPTQTLWYIFTITKTVRYSSTVIIKYGIANCILAIAAVNIFHDDLMKIYAIVGIQSVLGIFRFTTFLPFLGAKVLQLPKYTFFRPLMNYLLATAVITGISLLFKHLFIHNYSWWTLIAGACFTTAVGVAISSVFILTKTDREFILSKLPVFNRR